MAVAFPSIFVATTEKENTHTKLHVRYMASAVYEMDNCCTDHLGIEVARLLEL